MTRKLRNLKAAREEFVAAVRWYEEQRPGLGAEFFDAVVHATSLIQAQPDIETISLSLTVALPFMPTSRPRVRQEPNLLANVQDHAHLGRRGS